MLFFSSSVAAWIALRNSIPGRATGGHALALLAIGMLTAALTISSRAGKPHPDIERQPPRTAWRAVEHRGLAMDCAVLGRAPRDAAAAETDGRHDWDRRGEFSDRRGFFIAPVDPAPWTVLAGAIFSLLSVVAGAVWLNPSRLLSEAGGPLADPQARSKSLNGELSFQWRPRLRRG